MWPHETADLARYLWPFVALVCGVLLGTATGLVPGLHVNALAPVLVALGLALDQPMAAALVILGTATTHTILNVVPTLAAPLPDEDTALLLLPMQEMARRGDATLALRLSVVASAYGGLIALHVVLAALWLWPRLPKIPAPLSALVVFSLIMMLILRHPRGPQALLVFLVSGGAGLLLLDHAGRGVLGGDGSLLLPMFTGFFGLPMLLVVLHESWTTRGATETSSPSPAPEDAWAGATAPSRPDQAPPTRAAIAVGTGCGLLVSLFPGLTSATAGSFGRGIRGPGSAEEEVAMVSAIDTANAVGNLGALLLWGATRSGASIAMGTVLDGAGADLVALSATLLAGLVLTLLFASRVALALGPRLITALRRLEPRHTALGGLALLLGIVWAFTGIQGCLVALFVLPMGFLPHVWRVPRALLMGVLLVPYLMSALPTT